ncbi:MAG: hypothetical protein ACYDEY_05620 [Acidimicrobiales bacterium]
MNTEAEERVTLDNYDAEALWHAWAWPGDEDILGREAFERTLRAVVGPEDDGLYFRPGGWSVDLPATIARVACAAAILAGVFEIAGLHDVDREIIISMAGFLASMDVRPVRLTRQDRHLADRLRQEGLAGTAVSTEQARRSLPKKGRHGVTADQIADSLDRLVAAGYADREGEDEWVVRAKGSEAWLRLRLGRWQTG